MSTLDIVFITILLTLLAVFIVFLLYKWLSSEIAECNKIEQKKKIEFIRTVVKELNAEDEKSQDKQS